MPSPIQKKLVIVGDGGCGKTCLLYFFKENKFPERVPFFENYVAKMEVAGKEVHIALCDIAGQVRYHRLRPLSYNEPDVILLCFSIDSPTSFNNIFEAWAAELESQCPKVPIILVGNKVDLRTDAAILHNLALKNNQKPVSLTQGATMANKIRAVCYLECSASGEGIQKVFETACRASFKAKGMRPKFTIL